LRSIFAFHPRNLQGGNSPGTPRQRMGHFSPKKNKHPKGDGRVTFLEINKFTGAGSTQFG
jgi:hypothetical protein